MRRPPRSLAPAILAVTTLLSACGDSPSSVDDPPTTDPPGDDPTPPVAYCTNAALGAAAAEPFERVAVTGIQDITEEAWVEYESEGGATGITALFTAETGGAEIAVPANPDDLMGGGTLLLRVTDGQRSCEPLEIEVLPIEAAEGDPLGDLEAALEAQAEALAAQVGSTRTELMQASLAELSPEAVPVALLFEAIDAFDPASELAEMSASEAAFTQALLARMDLAAALNGLEALPALPASSGPAATSAAPANAPALSSHLGTCTSLGSVPPDWFGLDDPQTLSDYLKAARGADDSLGPLKSTISDVGTAFAVMGLAVPVVGQVAGWVAFGATVLQQMRANLYPSAITRLEFQLPENRVEEDWDTERGDPEIRWSFAKIWASNNGMGLARTGLDFITTAVGLPPAFRGAVANTAVGAVDIAAKEALNARLDELEQEPSAECWSVGATEFGPVVVPDDSGDEWVRAEILEGDAFEIDAADIRKLNPVRIGPATLRVRTQEEAFPGPFGFEDRPMEVLRKEVVWIPSTLLVENPGETATVKFRIDNARHAGPEDVEVIPAPELGAVVPTFADGVYTIELATPDDRALYPTSITARSMSKELPPVTPERLGTLDIFVDEHIEISPRSACIAPGEVQPLTALAGGPGDITVSWEIESGAGTLSASTGDAVEYQAPSSGSGTVTIRAYVAENPEVEDRVTLRYGLCAGLAAYHLAFTEITFPFTSPGACGNPDLDEAFEDITLSEEGIDPSVPAAQEHIWVDRSETLAHALSASGTFGDAPPGSESCVSASFFADASYEGTLTGSVDGTRLDLDITTLGRSNAVDMGDPFGIRASAAGAGFSLATRFDLEIGEAVSYRLRVELACDFAASLGSPDQTGVSVTVVRVDPSGEVLPPEDSTGPIQGTCGGSNPTLSLDPVLDFAAPSDPEQPDRVVILIQTSVSSFGAMGTETGEFESTGTMTGFFALEPQP
jgi:hypothetical protein